MYWLKKKSLSVEYFFYSPCKASLYICFLTHDKLLLSVLLAGLSVSLCTKSDVLFIVFYL